MIIRLATEEDLDELRRVYDTARAYMRAQGQASVQIHYNRRKESDICHS